MLGAFLHYQGFLVYDEEVAMPVRTLVSALVACVLIPAAASAGCVKEVHGARCVVTVTESQSTRLKSGDYIPDGSSMLFNPEYYGLPPVSGHWRYYRIDRQVYKVHPDTMQVLEIVSAGNSILR
ncbi:hypothetical protein OEZ60_19850 [Defluviimonas sp. WL0024]|uniref:Nickel/cobalt transporter regulator n=1 Tax=Albidovulum salinarum TaxID=2984153 RepID=A0ABT2X8H3_9RHOB|nr:hypothetical protein [Defluviimonas sp. WL0024]MCU9850248.1 hypothetical protein [Defluviimonas sp. WL0024]